MKKAYIIPEANEQPINCKMGICEVGSVQGNLDIDLSDIDGDPI